jgi:hypothetical protein
MKKINVKLSGIFIALLCVLSIQNVLAVDVPLKKDNGDPGTVPTITSQSASTMTTTTRAKTVISVSANVTGSELIVDFGNGVGTAFVSVVDQGGNVVYYTVVDTHSNPEVVIDGLTAGKYSLKIAYGSTKLIGTFQL